MKDTKVKCQSVNARMVSKVPEVVPRFGMLINWNLGTDKNTRGHYGYFVHMENFRATCGPTYIHTKFRFPGGDLKLLRSIHIYVGTYLDKYPRGTYWMLLVEVR